MKKIVLISLLILMIGGCTAQKLDRAQEEFAAQNYSSSLQILLPLAEKGNAKAQYAVGYMYYLGKGVPVNKVLGKQYIDQAASQGLPQAIKAQAVLQKQAKLNPLN